MNTRLLRDEIASHVIASFDMHSFVSIMEKYLWCAKQDGGAVGQAVPENLNTQLPKKSRFLWRNRRGRLGCLAIEITHTCVEWGIHVSRTKHQPVQFSQTCAIFQETVPCGGQANIALTFCFKPVFSQGLIHFLPHVHPWRHAL